ncbi:MAG: CalA, partial [Verrucomicrobiales bacterium]|nr:CalA [Verrucomicrobiales bacterium]
DGQGVESLVAFAIPKTEYFTGRKAAKDRGERLEQWISVWERNYQPIAGGEISSEKKINTIGYVRSDSGEQISDEEIRECIDLAVSQVMDHKPKCILEIGCGTGMLLFQFASRVEQYLATDLSQNAIDHISASLEDKSYKDRVHCFRCDASDLTIVPIEKADTVVIHSVAQYFPSIDYLTHLIESLARRLPPKARIFIGDVRDLRLLRAFHVWTLQRQCAPSTSKRRFRKLLADRIKLEKELVINPGYFKNLGETIPRIKQVRINPKMGKFQNEFVRFRYDVFLYLDEGTAEGVAPAVHPWSPSDSALEDYLRMASKGPLFLTDIPNRRLSKEIAYMEWLDSPGDEAPICEILGTLREKSDEGIDPFECLKRGAAEGITATLHTEQGFEDGRFQLYLQPDGSSGALPRSLNYGPSEKMLNHGANFPSFALDWEEHVPILKKALSEELPGCTIPSRFIFVNEFPLLRNGEINRNELAGEKGPAAQAPPVKDPKAIDPEYYDQSVAIIGISCSFPGAEHHEKFWKNLCEGIESSRVYPIEELRAMGVSEDRIANPHFVPVGMGIEGKANFDPDFFNISPRQAENMDPQARMLLQHTWQAIEEAGYAPRSIPETSVFMSAGNNYYQQASGLAERELQGMDGHEAGQFGQPGMIPAWISYSLGLKGPSFFVQSLCSSSMTGLHLACRSLLSKEVQYALVGAANLFAPNKVGYLYEPGLNLSSDGHCRSFDAAADGMVEGEGVCVVLLKRAREAIQDRDHIYALLRGVGLSQDGADKVGFSAPSLRGQSEAVRKVLQETGVPVETIRYVEAHGTGTPLGDSIEVAALTEGYQYGTSKKQFCGLGSTKPNIGNLDTVTGLIGCVKIALSLNKGEFPPVVNHRTSNPEICFENSPFYVVGKTETWNPGQQPIRIAQHVYSLGGTNAHAIYEEHRRGKRAKALGAIPILIPLSARTRERLQAYARKLSEFLAVLNQTSRDDEAEYLADLAYTLQVGRESMEHRVLFQVQDLEGLKEKLSQFANGKENGEGVFCGEVSRKKDLLQLIGDEPDRRAFAQERIAEGKWDKVANLWIRGVELDWNLIYGEQLPDRISLPTYPFLEEPYWLAQSKHFRDTGNFTTKIPERPAPAGNDSITVLERVDSIVRAAISDLLGLPAAELDANRVFNESGFDSVSLIRLTNQLNQNHRLNLTPAVLFEHSTICKLVRYLAEVKGAALPSGQNQNGSKTSRLKVIEEAKAVSTTVGQPERGDGKAERIAIVGMSGRFPQAADLEAFWENLKAGRDCISEVPPDRWSWEEYYGDPDEDPTKTKIKWGGFMDGVGEFDPLFFNLSPREAEGMDPQNRLLMMYVWLAMEDAGYSASSISGTNTGLFIGTGDTGYAGLVASEKRRPDYGFLGVYPFSGPNRMSYFLNLNGPSEPINTGCSSSLVAVHKAVVALETGACDMAFAGGVNTVPTPDGHITFSKVGMLCEDGRCKAFGSQANGFVRGEGAGILVLKRLSDAEAAGDHIYGVILGSAENHGGRSNSFTAPNPVAQAQLLETAHRKAGIDPRTVGYIETHGTGTKLGDPVEIEGLKKAFQSLAPNRVEGEQAFCGLGSVKSNIGHLEMAAGIAGLIKVLLQLKHKTLVPTLHCHEVNPLIQIEGSPFYIVQEAGKWRTVTDAQGRELPRRAGVSSFGVGGVNAHVVIEEYLPRLNFVEGIETKNEPFLIVLSAKKKEALQEAAGRLRGYLKKRPELSQVELRNIAYTLQAGREAMEERVAFVAKTQSSLVLALGRFLDGHESFDHCFRGYARQVALKESGVSDALIDARDLKSVAAFWVTGGIVDWPKMYCAPLPTRTSLPGYPFARERYWAVPAGRKEVVTNEIASIGRNCDPAKDGWQTSQVLGSVDWVEQLRRCAGKRITILYTDERDKNQFRQLLQQMSEAAQLTTPLRLRSVSVEELGSEEFGRAPEAIFILLGPNETKFPMEVNRILRRELSAKEIQIFVLHTGRLAGETEIPADEQHQWKLVECSENQISPSGQQLLLREWLAGARNEPTRGTPLFIRYESSQRFEWKAPISIPNHFLEKKWKPQDLPQQAANSSIGVTLVFVNEESVGLLPILNLQKPVLVGSSRVQSNRTDFIVDFADEASAALNIPDMLKACASVERIIDLSDLYRTPRDYDEEKFGKLAIYQALIGLFVPCQILHFTQGLQAFEAKQMSLAGAKFGGLVKMLSAEYSHISARTIDIDSEAFEKTGCVAEIVDAESQKNEETEICYRQGKRYVPFLVAESQKHFERTFSLRSDGVYIVTGGTRGIGFEIAKHLVSSGARKLVLLGIQSLPPKAEWQRAAQDGELSPDQRAQLKGFIELGQKLDQFEIYTGPLTDRKSLGEFFAGIRSRWGVIKGVIHSAGVYSEAHSSAFVTRDFARMRNVFEPKVRGTEQLHELLRFDDLDFFVSFSSLTGLIPRLARGLSDYAMANAFLDYFSAYQFHQNRRVCYRTITWVDWNEAGFAARMASEELERLEGKLREIGLISFSNRAGLRFFDLAMKTPNRDWVLPCALNLEAFNVAQPELLFGSASRVAPVKITKEIEPRLPERFDRQLEEWETAQASGISLSAEALEAFVPFEEIKRLEPSRINRVHALLFPNTKMEPRTGRGNGRTEVSEVIRKNLFDVLKIRELSDGEPFQNYGLDSISAMVFSNRLEKELKREVQPGWLIDFPTVETLALHLERQMEARRDYFE